MISDMQEKLFMKSYIEYLKKAEYQNRAFFTDFYNRDWMAQMLKQYGGFVPSHMIFYFGGYEGAERQMMGISPYELGEDEWPMVCLKIEVKTGIGKALTHRDFLGALLGLGIVREAIGDIILAPFGAYVILEAQMADYVSYSLASVGRYQNISLSSISFNEIEPLKPNTKTMQVTVASLRMDAIIAAAFGISRTTAAKLIAADKAKCNGVSMQVSYQVKEGDTVTLRGYGKIKIGPMLGMSKKEKLRIVIDKYI
ncbi:YlmH family RNA-binding protein [Cellulosilyticum ruminicola]|uniref:YlmH family RNA-binding protein n=1 Tax=Cellulosilyticum ruminicola TaxID=425254 RepID=UPI0006D00B12|nr:YlmH/Sll1252 family protein [Cellulosilyticum ruminicola]